MISFIVALSENNVIGRDNGLPWDLPDDLAFFRSMTAGKPMIMGRKTFEAIGRPLPKRQNIVITRDSSFGHPGVEVAQTPDQALALAGTAPEIMVIGGAQIFALFLPMAQRIYLTRVHTQLEGDTFFPTLDTSVWARVSEHEHPADARHAFAFTFEVWKRR